ncbi:MAG: 14-3-3 family protein [Bacilli bacterium]|nr:14-3-3 family protein [Bacilli bacterium]
MNLPLLKEFKIKIEGELDKTCEEIIKLLDEKLIPSAAGESTSEVFY